MLKKIASWAVITIAFVLLILAILIVVAIGSPGGRILIPVERKPQYEHPLMEDFPTRLQSQGNRIVDGGGNPILLRGVMPPDPTRLASQRIFDKDFYTRIRTAGANVVRLAVHPHYWVEDPDYLWRYIDPVVSWAGENGMYVIIDWHMIGNIETGEGDEMPEINTSAKDLTVKFWQAVAAYFSDTPNVIFDIWNEPAGGISAATWHRNATEIVQLIRARGADQLILVGGVEYARDLSWVWGTPIQDDNISYAAHIYPAHSQLMWDEWFGDVSQEYPVVLTEWGYMDENRDNAPFHLVGSQPSYGEPLLSYLKKHGIGWVACWYDDEWTPPMFVPGRESLSGFGAFALEQLQAKP
jgi:hypothetical protein